ncbi:MAG: hypothetical protein ABSH21_05000 [Verrucomicrobiia bacterium]|jgi:hypothetical protein
MPETKNTGNPINGPSGNDALLKQIERALEMMKRVRTVDVAQADKAPKESHGNRYVVPEPVVLRVGEVSST